MSSDFSFDALEPVGGRDVFGAGARASAVDPIGVAIGEAEAIREHARREGWDAGRLEAVTQARMELEPAAAALAQASADLVRAAAERATQLEREAVDLALAIAEKVVAGALELDPARVADVVAGALRALPPERDRVVVAVHPEDLELVRGTVGGVVDALGGIQRLDVEGDRRITRGGAVVRTDEGDVEATIEAKLERAREAILRELRPAGGADPVVTA